MTRGGKTFSQRPVVDQDGRTLVARKTTTSYNPRHAHYHPPHHHHHVVRHYHYHYWGPSYYYCYVSHWAWAPWFWGFYFAPFYAPWHYHWWWVGAPWHVHWGWYYDPYPYYDAPSYWVTDYTLSRMLEDEYARGYEDGYYAAEGEAAVAEQQQEGTPITEPVKEQIRVQVDEMANAFEEDDFVQLEKALEDPEYLFIVDTALSVTNEDGEACTLTGGDIIKQAEGNDLDPDRPVAEMEIVTSKSPQCPAGSTAAVSYADLQEMLNTFGQTVDDGLYELQKQREKEREASE